MPTAPSLLDQSRVEALRDYAILDTAPEEGFDDISRLASLLCGAPIVLITLLDLDRQWFKSRIGWEVTETPLKQAFCAQTIRQKKVFLVPDAMEDERFAGSPLVLGAPYIRFYAGAPLITPDGVPLGTLCIMDRMPRQLTEKQKEALAALARQVVALLELRRALSGQRAAEEETATLRDLLPVCGGCHRIRDDEQYCHELEGYFARHSGTKFPHGICPECAERLGQELKEKVVSAAN
ncbi:MAG: GAF domain-containing protein [Chthoniobacter sp.]|uniref:GAF domain-containing protein n=1 Tax=Chthoniobacter sp. TaxID=2510640 RepID=UPI0032AA5358